MRVNRRFGLASAIGTAIVLAAASCGSDPTPSRTTSAVPTLGQSSVAPAPSMSSTPAVAPSPTPEPTALPGSASLDGATTDPALGHRLPVAVMIDDSVAARPQYGFNAASIVYQAPADGGEDRYMALFQELDANRVEAIRSGRPYFVNWASEYRAAFAHYGGDAKTLKLLPGLDGKVLYNVDALSGSGSAFHRDAKRSAPHNAYLVERPRSARSPSSTGLPRRCRLTLASRPFADDLPADQRPTKGSITIPYNNGATGYTYDAKTNAYLRSVAGKAQIDAADGKRVTARNVVVLFMRLSIDPESEPGPRPAGAGPDRDGEGPRVP